MKDKIKQEIRTLALLSIQQKKPLYIDRYYVASAFATDERMVRKALSELRKENIIFIPIQNSRIIKGMYTLYLEGINDDLLERFVKTRISSIKTQYFNDVVGIKKIVKDQKLINEIGQIQIAFGD